ncbi:primosomal protein N' (replication factor Y) - superfamily II helicase [BEV proteobacterium]|nr:primosomal protein N' (replication factor Y) - superfamily II helicase [Candidatus Symbiopectobacterium sp. Chty_BC]
METLCPHCHHHSQQQAPCPEYQQPLQTLSACSSVSYFCQRGHGLISRQRVLFSYQSEQE